MNNNIDNACFINGIQYKCRTCFDPGQAVYSLAADCGDSKTWRDLLRDIAQLQTSENELLPKAVCCKCLDKLISYYDFILQIHNVNKKYCELLLMGCNEKLQVQILNEIDNSTNCLAESAIALPAEQNVPEIKLEEEQIVPYDIVFSKIDNGNSEENKDDRDPFTETCNEAINSMSSQFEDIERSLNEQSNQSSNDANNYDQNQYSSSSSNDSDDVPLKTLKKKKNYNSAVIPIQSSSSNESDNEPSNQLFVNSRKKTGGRKRDNESEKMEKVKSGFLCLICKKLFTLQRNCRRHILLKHAQKNVFPCGFCSQNFKCKDYLQIHLKRMHPGETLFSNTKQIEQLFGDRLYCKPTAWRLVQCRLCDTSFTSTKELREHLEKYGDVNTLTGLDLSSNIVKHLFSNEFDLNIIKETICNDIHEKHWFQYYTILNEHNYEMSVSDTEAEDLVEESVGRVGKYKCELCAEEFSYKYQVFSHLKEFHCYEEIPLKCVRCNLEFVSTKMYEQHRQTHCRNKNKTFLCSDCPAKFVWSENKKLHNCSRRIPDNLTPITTDQLKCNICDREFVEKLEYIEHLGSHSNERTLSGKAIIRCGLCARTFQKLKYLRQHLPLHADGKTGIDFNGCIYVKQFERAKSLELEPLQLRIQHAYSKSQISCFYQAIDKYGNELDISDSDSDTEDADGGETIKKQYACDICKEKFQKRIFLLNHQDDRHCNVSLPFTCKDCNQQYVSLNLLQQHLKRVCWNEHRRIAKQCEICNARFIWPDNLLKHKEIQNHTTNDVQIHYCLLCPKTFFAVDKVKDHLTKHCLTSADIKTVESIVNSTWWPNGEKAIKCKICGLTFKTMAKLKEHFSSNNQQNLCSDSHSLENYSITNQKGFELHLELDSETDVEDYEKETERTGDDEKTLYPYKCGMCCKSYKRKYQIAQHQRSMHNYELLQLKCERCIFRTVSQEVLDYHKATQCFNDEKEHECDQCSFKFMWKENLDNHIAIFHAPRDFGDPKDRAISDNSEQINIKSDIKIVHSLTNTQSNQSKPPTKKTYDKCECTICGASFSRGNLTVHMMRHRGEKPYRCNLCQKAFTRNADLKEHRRIHTGEYDFQCPFCDKRFSRKSKLTLHKLVHTDERPYQCTICRKRFRRSDSLKLHLRAHMGDKPFKCDICDKSFLCSSYLKKHRDTTGHNELFSTPINSSNLNVSEQQPAPKANKTSLCPICGIHLSSATYMTYHMRTHTGEKPYKCDFCELAFTRNSDLSNHRRIHTGERPYKCAQCGKAFTIRTKLKNHIRIHTDERPYQCKFCQRKFRRSEYLRLHLRKHTGENLSRCDVCGKAFVLPSYLNRHRIAMGHHVDKN